MAYLQKLSILVLAFTLSCTRIPVKIEHIRIYRSHKVKVCNEEPNPKNDKPVKEPKKCDPKQGEPRSCPINPKPNSDGTKGRVT